MSRTNVLTLPQGLRDLRVRVTVRKLNWYRQLACVTLGGVHKHSWPLLTRTLFLLSIYCFSFSPTSGGTLEVYVYNLILIPVDDL